MRGHIIFSINFIVLKKKKLSSWLVFSESESEYTIMSNGFELFCLKESKNSNFVDNIVENA